MRNPILTLPIVLLLAGCTAAGPAPAVTDDGDSGTAPDAAPSTPSECTPQVVELASEGRLTLTDSPAAPPADLAFLTELGPTCVLTDGSETAYAFQDSDVDEVTSTYKAIQKVALERGWQTVFEQDPDLLGDGIISGDWAQEGEGEIEFTGFSPVGPDFDDALGLDAESSFILIVLDAP